MVEHEVTGKTISDTAQGKDAPRGNFCMLYAEYLGRYDKV